MGLSLCRPKGPAPEPGLSLEELFEAMPRDPVFLPSTTYADVLAKLKRGGTHHVIALCIEEPNLARFEAFATILASLWKYKPENVTPIAMIPEICRSGVFYNVEDLKEQVCLCFVTSEPRLAFPTCSEENWAAYFIDSSRPYLQAYDTRGLDMYNPDFHVQDFLPRLVLWL